MDPRLSQVSWTGNVSRLHSLLKADPSILYDVVLSSSNTPLHVACMPGHLNFVQEILKLQPKFAQELNQDGYSPLHIASANGHVEIVKELLDFNQNLSLVVGKEGRIPLHNAVIKGKVNVVTQLLGVSVDSVELTTSQGETALHLAVRNNQFASFKLLVEHARQFNKEGVFTKKDNQGNTILHLAVSKMQYEVVELLLSGVSSDKILVNGLNGRGLTPLDVLQLSQSDAGEREIEEILKRAGALKASNLTSNFPDSFVTISTSDEQPLATNNQAQPQSSTGRISALSLINGNIENVAPDVRNTLLIIAILITTATYQAMYSPPGGLVQEGLHAGKSIMAMNHPRVYTVFSISNSIGFFISIYLIYFLSRSFPFRVELWFGIFSLVWTYDICMVYSIPFATCYMRWLALFISLGIPGIVIVAMSILNRRLTLFITLGIPGMVIFVMSLLKRR